MASSLTLISDKAMNKAVAHHVETQAALKEQATKTAEQIRGFIAPHSRTGTYEGSINISHGKVDWYVYSDDPKAAYKDYPHVTEDGTVVNGVGAFRRAMNGG